MSMPSVEQRILQALHVRKQSYSPYSEFCVGAALCTKNGQIYTGCNIENASYPVTNCAERTAFFKAVSEGEREFASITIVGGKKELDMQMDAFCPPCGVCLQVMMEFCNPKEFEVVLAKSEKEYEIYKLIELLPKGFGPGNLKK